MIHSVQQQDFSIKTKTNKGHIVEEESNVRISVCMANH